jgi:hypothetical protein
MPNVRVNPIQSVNVRVNQRNQAVVSGTSTFVAATDAQAQIDYALQQANTAVSAANQALALANTANANVSSKISKSGDTMTGSLTFSGEGHDIKFSRGSSLIGNDANNAISLIANNLIRNTAVSVQEDDGGLAQVYSNGRVEIITDTGGAGALWTFGNDGKLTAPGALSVAGNASVNSLTVFSNNFTMNAVTIDGGTFS